MIIGEIVLTDGKSNVCDEFEEMAFKAMLDNNMKNIVDSVAK